METRGHEVLVLKYLSSCRRIHIIIMNIKPLVSQTCPSPIDESILESVPVQWLSPNIAVVKNRNSFAVKETFTHTAAQPDVFIGKNPRK